MSLARFKRFADIFPVKGHNRGVLYDLGRKAHFMIPNSFIGFLEFCEGKSQAEIEESLQPKGIYPLEYFQFMMEKEFGFWTETPDFFPPLNLEWQSPSYFSNIIWDVEEELLPVILNCVQELNIKAMHLRFSGKDLKSSLSKTLKAFEGSTVKALEVAFPFSEAFDTEFLRDLLYENPRVSMFIAHGADTDGVDYLDERKAHFYIRSRSPLFYDPNRCLVNRYSFKVDMELFIEAQSHHSYFNKKLYINSKGELRNAPECAEVFGNLHEINRPKEILNLPGMGSLDQVAKSKVDICKDCEFRYMCVDNRVPKNRGNEQWYHSSPCNYNPYISKWNDEPGFLSLEECGVISNEQGFSIDEDKITSLNQRIWQNA
ncbi:grasp-with-spasm system SPASM domain peptide maturase [Croceimicrobium sp.]|uniref:grasp-with-spasm system SPASM domain peptide maturase n=1 Tax=Croceimicrobium sp. TaxID=2828340 RepID=UPI003BA8ED7F